MTSSKPTKVGSFHSQEKRKKMVNTNSTGVIMLVPIKIYRKIDVYQEAQQCNDLKGAKCIYDKEWKAEMYEEKLIKVDDLLERINNLIASTERLTQIGASTDKLIRSKFRRENKEEPTTLTSVYLRVLRDLIQKKEVRHSSH